MAGLRGERFHIDLDDDDIAPDQQVPQRSLKTDNLVGDIVERTSSSATPPSEPAPKSGSALSGWPAHKKRYLKTASNTSDLPTLPQRQKSFSIEDTSFDALQKQQIDAENRRRISEMSPDEIEQERKDLFENLSPGLIAKLLARATIDDPTTDGATNPDRPFGSERRRSSGSSRKVSFAVPDEDESVPKQSAESHSLPLSTPLDDIDENHVAQLPQPRRLSSGARKVSFMTPEPTEKVENKSTAASHSLPPTPPATDASTPSQSSPRRMNSTDRKVSFAEPEDRDEENRTTAESHSIPMPSNVDPILETNLSEGESVHFPKPPAVPDLDPNSETFLDDLHTKYFPSLAHDPSKLEWMKPSEEGENASYDPSASHVLPEYVRFDFKGKLIPPSKAMSLPTNIGLHHHGDAPDAAGYTISELGTLSRSAFPAQRCIAIQTIGRILFRLGKCEFGDEAKRGKDGADGEGAVLTGGLWDEVEKSRIIDTLSEWANKTSGHRTSIALAQEAVWNWQQGGGRKQKSTS